MAETNYVRLRGLPFAAKERDIRDFLQGINAKTITFTLTANGRASGECYAELDDAEAVKEARKLDRNEISGRYIEVFTVSEDELSMLVRHGVIKLSGGDSESRYASNYVVRLRGLPYSATIEDIKEFFTGLEVADAVIDKEPGGRPSGEAFVRLASKQDAELALERSKNYMGSRYVEVFRSSMEEMDNCYYASRGIPAPRSGPVPLRGVSPTLDYRYRDSQPQGRYAGVISSYGDYGGRYGGPIRALSSIHTRPAPYERPYERERYLRYGARDLEYDDLYDPAVKVFMRGLPYSVGVLDIEEFFRPLQCTEIKLGYNEDRRLSGDGLVSFSTMAEAREALKYNKKNMGSRYIELFPATGLPYPMKTVTFRTIAGGGPQRLSSVPRPLYSSFEDDDVGYRPGGGYMRPPFRDDPYESRSKYGREWGEPARPSWHLKTSKRRQFYDPNVVDRCSMP